MAIGLNVFLSGENARECANEIIDAGLLKQVHAESGNHMYDFFFAREDANCVLLVENWEDQASLERHMNGAPFKEIGKITSKYALKSKLHRFVTED